MTMITIPTWKSFAYNEVWEITEYRNGCIYKTKPTGKFVKSDEDVPDGYVKSSISTTLLHQDNITLEMFYAEENHS